MTIQVVTGPGATPIYMKQTGMLIENFEIDPKGDQIGGGSSFLWPLKETKNSKKYNLFFSISSCAALNETLTA